MRFRILVVGENKVSYLVAGEADYLRRLERYCRVDVASVRGEKIKGKRSVGELLGVEGERLMKQIPRGSFLVVLDRQGETLSSEELARQILDWQNRAVQEVIFLVGGPLGLGDEVLARANLVVSLSRMTFTHEMVRLILLEQLYRSFTILRGEKYHK